MALEQVARPSEGSPVAWVVAGCLAGAAVVHFAVIAEHTGGDAIVPVGFALTGWVQAVLAVLVVRAANPRPALVATIVANAAFLGVWAISRTAGLPFDPYGGAAEAVGTLDLTAAALQAAAIALAAGLLVSPVRLRIPQLAGMAIGLAAIALGSVVVITPEASTDAPAAEASASGGAAAGGAAGHHGGAAAPAAVSSGSDHAADMLKIDRSRCDLAMNPQGYWDEATAMAVDTYTAGAMTMRESTSLGDVTKPSPLNGKGSEQLDRLISLTSVSSGEGAAAALILELARSTDEEYDAWRQWVVANPGDHGSTVLTPGQDPVPTMGHPGPQTWKAIVDKTDCARLTDELDLARKTAMRYPTVAEAKAAGWRQVTGYVPGIAAHFMNFSIVDGSFDIEEPEMLLYDGTSDEASIIGLSYYVRLDGTVEPTQGFVGENDRFHKHFGLCNGPGGVLGDSTTTVEECKALGGVKSTQTNGWMSHAWIVPGCESPWGVFSGENPIVDQSLGESSGKDGGGCAGSKAKERYDLSPGTSDLAVRGSTEEAAG